MDVSRAAQRMRGKRRWMSINLPTAQYARVTAACNQGFARNNDEFVRIWTEVGLVLTSLAPTLKVLEAAKAAQQEPVPARPP